MKRPRLRKALKRVGLTLLLILAVFVIWQLAKPVPTEGDWKDTLKLLSTAEFDGHLVTVRNVRNFQYDAAANPTVEDYYDRTYDLDKLNKVWYITDPFDPGSAFAHTWLSFGFSDGSYLSITIEGRLKKGQQYSMLNGTLHTFPLMYIAADERDVIYVRANIHKDGVFVYPLVTTPKDARLLLIDMLDRMNDLAVHPAWYNSILANCTSSIADHVNKTWPGLLPRFDWQVLLTGYADSLADEKVEQWALVDAWISKPIDSAALKRTVEEALPKARKR